jgi:hypothetical protein
MEGMMNSLRRIALLLAVLSVALPLAAAPAEDDLDVMYLADMTPLETNSIENMRPRTLILRAEMDGVVYANSLGLKAPRAGPVHATFNLGRKYARFQSRIGLPDNLAIRGRLSFEVVADGREIFKSPIMRMGDTSTAVDLDVTGVQRLTVRARNLDAKEGYLIAWGDAKLLPPGRPTTNDQRPTTARSQEPGAAAPVWAVDGAGVDALAKALKRGLTTRAAGVKGAVVLAEFRGIDLPTPSATRVFAEELATALIRQGVPLVERGQLDATMAAMKLTPDAGLSPARVKELGRRAGAALLIVGSLADRGDTVVANARILRTDTGAAVWAERAELLRSR